MTKRRRLYVLLGIAALALTAWTATRFDLMQLDPAAVAAQVRAAGPLGSVVLFALLVLQCVVAPLPSEPLMMAAGFVYGATGGFLLAWLGVVTGALLCFGLARSLGRAFAERLVGAEKLAALDVFDDGSARAATFAAVLVLRLFAFTAFDVVSYGCGLIRFPFRWFLVATGVGAMPKVFVFTYFGANVTARPGWVDWAIVVGTFGMLLAAPWLVRVWRRRQIAASGPEGG